MKREMMLSKGVIMTSQRMSESIGLGLTKRDLQVLTWRWLRIFDLELVKNDQEFVVVVPHGIHLGLHHLSVLSPVKSSSSEVESASVKQT